MTKTTFGPWAFEAHIPHGSGDAEWRVIDPQSDNNDVIAIIDPDFICDELGIDPADYARLIAAAPELLAALKAIAAAGEYPLAGPTNFADGWNKAHEKLCSFARAAIAKAE